MNMKLREIEERLDRTFKRNMMADDDGETSLAREVHALEDAVREIVNFLDELMK